MNIDLVRRIGLAFCLGLSLLIVVFWLAWQLLAPANFGYSLAYEWMDIEQHVQRYGPQNRYKVDFADTTSAEQKRLFGAIVHEIQHGGEGLARIFYTTTDGRRYTLLGKAEVIHLQDVAHLIAFFDKAAGVALLVLLVTLGYLKWQRLPSPPVKHMLVGLGGLLLAGGLVLLINGAEETFYWLHIQIFPADHEWFFYYQDSLMTTLMKAPNLFGFIAALWVTLALVLLVASYWGIRRWLAIPSRG